MQMPTPAELAKKIPAVSQVDLAFPAGKNIDRVYDELIPIARQWVEDNPGNWGTKFFTKVFYGGGTVPDRNTELEDVAEEDTERVLMWLKAGMASFYPGHNDKEAVCGMLWQTFFRKPVEAPNGNPSA